jgi:hypothetical protein
VPPKNEKQEIKERFLDVRHRVLPAVELNVELPFVNDILPSAIVTLDRFEI